MTVFWLCLHLAGYVALATLLPSQTVRFALGRRDAHRLVSAARRDERIAKLELQLGIGLDYGREWLLSQPIACKDYERDLVNEGNGACPRRCWGCEKEYRPHDEYPDDKDIEGVPSWYDQKQTPEVRELTDRLCRSCYLGATLWQVSDACEGLAVKLDG